jgi:diketogulonate reductase-like aldo/keto reductase
MIHFPIPLKFVPFEERYPPEWIFDPKAANPCLELDYGAPTHLTWKGMEELVDQGLSRFIGVCNFNVQHIMDVLSYARIKPYANQVEMHPYLTQLALVEFCQRHNIKMTAFSPFGSASYIELGMDYGLKRGLLDDPVVATVAANHGRTNAQVLLRWSTQRNIAVIPKTSNLNHLAENLNVNDFTLSNDEVMFSLFVFLTVSHSRIIHVWPFHRWRLLWLSTRTFASTTLASSANLWVKLYQSLIKFCFIDNSRQIISRKYRVFVHWTNLS